VLGELRAHICVDRVPARIAAVVLEDCERDLREILGIERELSPLDDGHERRLRARSAGRST
jgi:hypothetical protein